MDVYENLFHMSKTLLSGGEDHRLPAFFLRRMVRLTNAAHGLIVVNEDGQFNEKMQLGFSGKQSEKDRRLCKSMVRRAIAKRTMVTSENLGEDSRFTGESVQLKQGVAAMAMPLISGNNVYACIYLERGQGDPPFSDEDQFLLREFGQMAGHALHLAVERDYLTRLSHQEAGKPFDFGGIVCRHPKMLAVLDLVTQIADSDASVLVRGETGTGKELIARAIYLNSDRRNKPYVTLHCGALPENLFEAELFGHRKGAFTGADRDRQGRIAQAAGGTLFLDEVAEIPLPAQAKLLRFFQFGEYQRIGSDHVAKVDVRIIAATHQSLEEMVEQGRFRQDLYYRLNVVELELPPLRERAGDIPFLLDAFLAKYWQGKGDPIIAPEALRAIMSHSWPGNVRELAHSVERACLLGRNGRIELRHLPEALQTCAAELPTNLPDDSQTLLRHFTNEELKEMRQQVTKTATANLERSFCEGLMARHGSNVAEAAKAAGMQITYLYKLLARTGVPYN